MAEVGRTDATMTARAPSTSGRSRPPWTSRPARGRTSSGCWPSPDLDDRATLDRALPVDASRAPRRASLNAQLRAEMFGSFGDLAGTMESLSHADGNSLVDLVWLDRCPLFDPLRLDGDFVKLRARVEVRASRVIAALDTR